MKNSIATKQINMSLTAVSPAAVVKFLSRAYIVIVSESEHVASYYHTDSMTISAERGVPRPPGTLNPINPLDQSNNRNPLNPEPPRP